MTDNQQDLAEAGGVLALGRLGKYVAGEIPQPAKASGYLNTAARGLEAGSRKALSGGRDFKLAEGERLAALKLGGAHGGASQSRNAIGLPEVARSGLDVTWSAASRIFRISTSSPVRSFL